MNATPYDQIAPFYDHIHGNRKKTIRYIKHLLKTHYPHATSLLDLACGTGTILQALPSKLQLSGLDLSAGMLAAARKKLPKIDFYQRDMSNFKLPQKFDVITCLFASLNHLLKFEQWQTTIQHAKQHLKPKGIFIFDIFTDYCLNQLVINSPIIIETKTLKTVGYITLTEHQQTRWDIIGFDIKSKSTNPLFQEHILQTTFSIEKITDYLNSIFDQIITLDPEHSSIQARSELLYFICKN